MMAAGSKGKKKLQADLEVVGDAGWEGGLCLFL